MKRGLSGIFDVLRRLASRTDKVIAVWRLHDLP